MPDTPLMLPEYFVRTIVNTFGPAGADWLTRLPALLTACEQRWKITLLPAFSNLSYNYVAPAICADGSPAVLKAGVPCAERQQELAAVRAYDGRGCARLLAFDDAWGVMLLERLSPGTPLTTLADAKNDAQATHIAANVMRALWRPVPAEHAFPHIEDWAKGMTRMREHFTGGLNPFPAPLVHEAETLWTDLLASAAPPVLLHGDLHHDNILQSGSENSLHGDVSAGAAGWRAIDPKGLVGEPAYEVGALLRNLWPERHTITDPATMLARRVHQLAEELELSRERVRGWGVAQAVLSAWWTIEDGGDDWQNTIAIAELLAAVRN